MIKRKVIKEGKKMKQPDDSRDMKELDGMGNELLGVSKHAWGIATLYALVFVFIIGFAFPQKSEAKDLKAFYQQNCARCHGPDGSAVSAEGKKLRGQNFTDPDWQLKTSDDEMVKTILKGKFFGMAMPSFKSALTKEEAQQMVTDIIRKSKKGQVIAPDSKMTDEK
jgi:mono/diheme cytochrome c family protein